MWSAMFLHMKEREREREMRAVANLLSQFHQITSLFFSVILPETLKLTVLVVLFLWSSSKRARSKYKYMAEIDRKSFKFIFGNINRKFKLPEQEDESITCRCSICLSEYIEGEEGRELQCKHRFHRNCLEKWLQECPSSATCPICRFLVLPKQKLLEYRLAMRSNDRQVGSVCEKEIAILLLLLSAGRHSRSCNGF